MPYPFQRHESRYLHHATAPLADDYLVDIYSALGWYSKSTGCTLPSRFLKLSGNHDLKLIAVDLHFLPLCWYSSEIKNLKYMTNGVSTCCKYWYVGKNIKKDWYEYLIGAANFGILELAAQSSRCLFQILFKESSFWFNFAYIARLKQLQFSFPYFTLLVPCPRLSIQFSVIPCPQSCFPFSLNYLFSTFWLSTLFLLLTLALHHGTMSLDGTDLFQRVGRQRRRLEFWFCERTWEWASFRWPQPHLYRNGVHCSVRHSRHSGDLCTCTSY